MVGGPLRYVPYHELGGRPNVVVDGAATDGTVLTLSHWPGGRPPPAGLAADLSAEMAFAYLAAGVDRHSPATAVSNSHLDQDGLVSILALTDPGTAAPRRELLVDIAAAGDWATYRHRRAARASMTVAAWADPERSPLALPEEYPDQVALLHDELLGRLVEMGEHPDRYRSYWAEEDDALTRSEAALASGATTITEWPAVDLAVVDLGTDPDRGGHRFAHLSAPWVHPMAVHNATDRTAVLLRRGRNYLLTYRYETWVRFVSRPVRARRDLAPLAAGLTDREPGGVSWIYSGSGDLTPTLALVGSEESAIEPDAMVRLVHDALRDGPPDAGRPTPG